jgi:hypothetical protein
VLSGITEFAANMGAKSKNPTRFAKAQARTYCLLVLLVSMACRCILANESSSSFTVVGNLTVSHSLRLEP